jgi:hypothetical protein
MVKIEKRQHRFRSPTREGFDDLLLEWQRNNPGVPFTRHPIEELLPSMQRSVFEHSKTKAPDAFSMVIEYEVKSPPSKRYRAPKYK